MLGLVRHARACPRFSKITKQQYLWEGLSYFVYLLHVVTHPWKLQCYHVVLVVLVGMPKVIWSNKSPISLEKIEWFCWFFASSYLHLVRYPLKLQKCAILGCIVRHSLSAIQIVRCFKPKKTWTRYEVSSWLFCFRWS